MCVSVCMCMTVFVNVPIYVTGECVTVYEIMCVVCECDHVHCACDWYMVCGIRHVRV